MLRIYTRSNCPHCEKVEIPSGILAVKVDINDSDYRGFRPPNVPVLQVNGLNLEGPHAINTVLNLIKQGQDGKHRE